MKTVRTYLIADRILSGPAKVLLARSHELLTDDFGVSVFADRDARIVVVDPLSFSIAHMASVVRVHMQRAVELKILAPSAILYFASGMDTYDPIFKAIDKLSHYVIGVQNAPVFRMLHDNKAVGVARYMHKIMFGAFPLDQATISCKYVDPEGKLLDVEQLGLDGVEPIDAPPLVFHHSGLSEQRFTRDSLIQIVDEEREHERVAFDELMLRFPSRDPDPEELRRLADQLKLSEADIDLAWKHNRRQWDEVRQKLAVIGYTMPGPAKRGEDKPEYHQFSHLVMSGALKLLTKTDIKPGRIRYIGLPMFARNGVTIPLGRDGIARAIAEFAADTLDGRIVSLLPQALSARFSVDVPSKPRPAVVEAGQSAY